MVDRILRRNDSSDGFSNPEKESYNADPEKLKPHKRTTSSMVMQTENFNQELLENILKKKVEFAAPFNHIMSVGRKPRTNLDTSTTIRMLGTEVISKFNV